MEISVKEARSRISEIIDRVQGGEEVIITRRGKKVALMVPPRGEARPLPSLKDFRASIRITGEPLSVALVRNREEERY